MIDLERERDEALAAWEVCRDADDSDECEARRKTAEDELGVTRVKVKDLIKLKLFEEGQILFA